MNTTIRPLFDWSATDRNTIPPVSQLAEQTEPQLAAFGVPYDVSVRASERQPGWHVGVVLDQATGRELYRGRTAYYDPRAALDAALAYARNLPAILENGPNTRINYYFKVRDGESDFISGLPLPGGEKGVTRGYTFVECTFNVDSSWRFVDCVFVCCAPHERAADCPLYENCVIDGPVV